MPDLARIAADIAAAYIPPQTGRPSSIGDHETLQVFLEAIENGNYLETACELADISKETFRQWKLRADAGETPYTHLIAATKRASARAEAAEVTKVRKAGEDPRFWAASMTYLERRHPERWARRQEGNDGPKVVVQIGVNDKDVQVNCISVSYTPTSLSPSLSEDMHSLSAERNPRSV